MGERIREARTDQRLSLRKLGEMVGISHSFLDDVERGRRGASDEVIGSLAKALGLNRRELLAANTERKAS